MLMTRRAWSPAAFLTLLMLGALSAACNTNGTPPADDSAAPAADVAKDTGEHVTVQLLKERTPVAAFSLTDMSGREHSFADWKGKVVLVNFWATWCGPCRAEIPDLVELQEKYRDHLVIVGISEDDGPTAADLVTKFADEHKINYTIGLTGPKVQEAFPANVALPTSYMIDKEGRIAQKHVGLLNPRATEATLRSLAGLEVNATIEEVDDPNKLSDESAAQITEVPGIDLAGLSDAKRVEVLKALNDAKCSCGCDLSVAKCRIDDPTCPVSLPQAKEMVAKMAS
jgi:thiol-disulfide isomerase/thioredoxin